MKKIIFRLLLLSISLVLVGCFKESTKTKVTVKCSKSSESSYFNDLELKDLFVLESDEYKEFNKGDSYTAKLKILPGIDEKSISLYVNNEKVDFTIKYLNEGSDIDKHNSYLVPRLCEKELVINENTEIRFDIYNARYVNIPIEVSSEFIGSKYAYESSEHQEYFSDDLEGFLYVIQDRASSNLNLFDIPENNIIEIPYNSNLYLVTPNNYDNEILIKESNDDINLGVHSLNYYDFYVYGSYKITTPIKIINKENVEPINSSYNIVEVLLASNNINKNITNDLISFTPMSIIKNNSTPVIVDNVTLYEANFDKHYLYVGNKNGAVEEANIYKDSTFKDQLEDINKSIYYRVNNVIDSSDLYEYYISEKLIDSENIFVVDGITYIKIDSSYVDDSLEEKKYVFNDEILIGKTGKATLDMKVSPYYEASLYKIDLYYKTGIDNNISSLNQKMYTHNEAPNRAFSYPVVLKKNDMFIEPIFVSNYSDHSSYYFNKEDLIEFHNGIYTYAWSTDLLIYAGDEIDSNNIYEIRYDGAKLSTSYPLKSPISFEFNNGYGWLSISSRDVVESTNGLNSSMSYYIEQYAIQKPFNYNVLFNMEDKIYATNYELKYVFSPNFKEAEWIDVSNNKIFSSSRTIYFYGIDEDINKIKVYYNSNGLDTQVSLDVSIVKDFRNTICTIDGYNVYKIILDDIYISNSENITIMVVE